MTEIEYGENADGWKKGLKRYCLYNVYLISVDFRFISINN